MVYKIIIIITIKYIPEELSIVILSLPKIRKFVTYEIQFIAEEICCEKGEGDKIKAQAVMVERDVMTG